jgi:ABC-type nitrate/sulfonate/bicarbonate transport system permease component
MPVSSAPGEAAPSEAAPSLWRLTRRDIVLHGFTVVFVAMWWGYAQLVPAYLLPGPWPVLQRMAQFLTDPTLTVQLMASLGHVATALVLSFLIGGALAVTAHAVPVLRLLIDARLTPFLNAFSGIGWLFLAILWFGINSVTVVFAVTLILTPFTTINIRTGLNELDRDLVELGRSLTRSRLPPIRTLIVPMLVPYGFAALRTGFGVAWKVVLTAELFGGNVGVGYLLNTARQEFDTETIFAVIVFIILFVALTETVLFRPLQRRLDRRYRHG